MQRQFNKRNVYNAGKNSTDQELVFQHMCNHYRRILNAKKVIDNSPPYCYKAKRPSDPNAVNQPSGRSNEGNKALASRNTSPALTDRSISTTNSHKPCWAADPSVCIDRYYVSCVSDDNAVPVRYTCIDMDLVDRITYDTKNAPAAYCDEGWREIKALQKDRQMFNDARQSKSVGSSPPNTKRRLPQKAVSESQQKRMFSLQVKNQVRPEIPIACSHVCKCPKICVCDSNDKPPDNSKEQSQTSSRDSAYNGGVSSLPESRSPTPDQRKKECNCHKDNYYSEKTGEPEPEPVKQDHQQETRSEFGSAESPRSRSASITVDPQEVEKKDSLKKMKEDALYVQFLEDITAEVLEKGLYTNKALTNIMRRHLKQNLNTLDRDRMIREVDRLSIQLGIPKDKGLHHPQGNFYRSSPDNTSSSAYLVMLDSEFRMPILHKSRSEINPAKEDRYDASGTSHSSEDSVMMSVIQVTNPVKDTKKGKSLDNTPTVRSPSLGNSGYESDQSSELTKSYKSIRGKKHNLKSSNSSSSDSEEIEKMYGGSQSNFLKLVDEEIGRGVHSSSEELDKYTTTSSTLIMERRFRSVSFRNNEYQQNKKPCHCTKSSTDDKTEYRRNTN